MPPLTQPAPSAMVELRLSSKDSYNKGGVHHIQYTVHVLWDPSSGECIYDLEESEPPIPNLSVKDKMDMPRSRFRDYRI
jgi:hypothetical protein